MMFLWLPPFPIFLTFFLYLAGRVMTFVVFWGFLPTIDCLRQFVGKLGGEGQFRKWPCWNGPNKIGWRQTRNYFLKGKRTNWVRRILSSVFLLKRVNEWMCSVAKANSGGFRNKNYPQLLNLLQFDKLLHQWLCMLMEFNPPISHTWITYWQ